MPAALHNAIDHDVDDPTEDVGAYRLASEQQPQVDRAQHGLDDLAGLDTGCDLATLDRMPDSRPQVEVAFLS